MLESVISVGCAIDQNCGKPGVEKLACVIVRARTPQLEGITGVDSDRVRNACLLGTNQSGAAKLKGRAVARDSVVGENPVGVLNVHQRRCGNEVRTRILGK